MRPKIRTDQAPAKIALSAKVRATALNMDGARVTRSAPPPNRVISPSYKLFANGTANASVNASAMSIGSAKAPLNAPRTSPRISGWRPGLSSQLSSLACSSSACSSSSTAGWPSHPGENIGGKSGRPPTKETCKIHCKKQTNRQRCWIWLSRTRGTGQIEPV